MSPTVSIVLPTYNRARFLPQAFASIRSQTFQDWDLIVVDDGSTDDTCEVVAALGRSVPQPVRYLRQENAGPAAARNAGVDRASGKYVAFYDSDDRWWPEHLADCVTALEANPDVDWVYAATRRVEYATGQVLHEHSFWAHGRPRPFRSLRTRRVGDLHIIDDRNAARCMIRHGLFCGLQSSVLRRKVFERLRLPLYRVSEDEAFAVSTLKAGCRLGYLNAVHVDCHTHDDNCSATRPQEDIDRSLRVLRTMIQVYEDLGAQLPLSVSERRAVDQRLGREYFWQLGYSLLWQNGRRDEALEMYRRGLRRWPWDWRCWKTYFLARWRTWMRSG